MALTGRILMVAILVSTFDRYTCGMKFPEIQTMAEVIRNTGHTDFTSIVAPP